MFDQYRVTKHAEQLEARRLRGALGLSYKAIATQLSVSPSTAHAWTSDIPVAADLAARNARRAQALRAEGCRETTRARRQTHQDEGRRRARLRDPLHVAGCMLYWAEGDKDRNCARFANSDPHMVRFFVEFLERCFGLAGTDLTARVNCYPTLERPLEVIEEHWREVVALPGVRFSKATVNNFPTSSSGRKTGKLPYGVCTVGVKKSTWLIQHIYGAIQEYAGFEEPAWLG